MATTHNIALLLVICLTVGAEDLMGSRTAVDNQQADSEFRELDKEIETGKLYFTGTGYTVNLIPHAIVLGLLTFAVIFLYGDSLFGTEDISGYGAPSTGYGAPEASYGAPAASYGAPAPSYAAPEPSYAAPAPSYGAPSYAAQRYYDPYAAQAATSLGAEVYSPELNPYNIQQEAAVAAEGRK